MPKSKRQKVESLSLDLRNYRTIHQTDEEHAISALIGINPDWFWALLESLLDDGYSPTENIIVLQIEDQLVVREGNRRIAAMKLILGFQSSVEIPENLQAKIENLPTRWRTENSTVPCAIFSQEESAAVDRLVSRTHGKGEKAGRDKWTAVARARFSRELHNQSEVGLDMLEKYLAAGKNLSVLQKERWSGDYPLTVLNEALPRLAAILGFKTTADLVSKYPLKNKNLLDRILMDIGLNQLTFPDIRSTQKYWGETYGLTQPKPATAQSSSATSKTGASSKKSTTGSKAQPPAIPLQDPKSVKKTLTKFQPRGNNREKVATVLDEISRLKLDEFPHAFCLLLRTLFELSAKAYSDDHKSSGLTTKKADGSDRTLIDVLRSITAHMTKNSTDRNKIKELHGAIAEMGKAAGLLSVTSMNQLVHHPSFSIQPPDISLMFHNVFPLLREMNN